MSSTCDDFLREPNLLAKCTEASANVEGLPITPSQRREMIVAAERNFHPRLVNIDGRTYTYRLGFDDESDGVVRDRASHSRSQSIGAGLASA